MTTFAKAPAARSRVDARILSIAYTPDSDDAFNFLAWESGQVAMRGWEATFSRNHIAELNRAAAEEAYDVVAVSSVAYPALADRYAVLAVGSSVGRGYGPVLVARSEMRVEQLAGARVAVPALNTTGGVLARMFCPGSVTFLERPYDRIAAAVLRGEVDAGVMIHEELVHYPALGLRRVLDLGGAWSEQTGLPLPVGLNIVRRALMPVAVEIARACRQSLQWATDHREEAMAEVGRLGRGRADVFVPMFSNTDTMRMPADVRAGLRVLFDQLAARGWAPALDRIEVIDA